MTRWAFLETLVAASVSGMALDRIPRSTRLAHAFMHFDFLQATCS
jgi:hypothetical protein